jgi:hypothetical protein
MDKAREQIRQALDLNKATGVIAEKRGTGPVAITMAASNSLSSCLATAAMLQIVTEGWTMSEAIAHIKEHGTEILADVMRNALGKLMSADIPGLVREFNETNPDSQFGPLRPGWDS